ncbi:MAG TPA: ferric reductase-like transmembrane domain-containing protein [Acidimicrobiales bacterium]|nr:ferric reductase-like transmembrane domain-containing protein [Acidimicrobiales bacterium]
MSEQLWWHLTRASGLVAWALLTAAVLFGLVVRTKVGAAPARPPWWLDLHRFLGGLAVVFTAAHLATLVADSYVRFTLLDLLVPGASNWRTGAVAWGVVALWLLLAVEGTSLLQRRLPRRAWRWVHISSYPLFWVATLHFLTAGTDASSRPAAAFIVAACAAVAFFSIVRSLLPQRGGRAPAARAAPTT